jgi:hypothetical protein
MPYRIGRDWFPADWNALIYLGAENYEPNMYQINLQFNKELLAIADGGQNILGNDGDLFQFTRIGNKIAKISCPLIT